MRLACRPQCRPPPTRGDLSGTLLAEAPYRELWSEDLQMHTRTHTVWLFSRGEVPTRSIHLLAHPGLHPPHTHATRTAHCAHTHKRTRHMHTQPNITYAIYLCMFCIWPNVLFLFLHALKMSPANRIMFWLCAIRHPEAAGLQRLQRGGVQPHLCGGGASVSLLSQRVAARKKGRKKRSKKKRTKGRGGEQCLKFFGNKDGGGICFCHRG